MPSDRVECSTHGPGQPTFVCKHVAFSSSLGFDYAGDSPDAWPDAVCTACAAARPWSDAFARDIITMLCSRCWESAFERNTLVPAVADEPEWFRRALARAEPKQERWKREFHIGSFTKYRYCFDPGEAWLAFGDHAGFRVRCDAHVIGSFSPTSGTWLWGWANDHWEERVTRAIIAVKRRGEREGVRSLTRSIFKAEEANGWDLAIAVLDTMPEVEAVYRAPGEGSLFLAVTATRWVS